MGVFQDLFNELQTFEYLELRPAQQQVLEGYEALLPENRSSWPTGDVAIEMPAGTGKTLVALLVAEYHRRQGRKVAILTGTRQLANQVAEDANELGLNHAVFEGPSRSWSPHDKSLYRRGGLVAILNYWAYLNVSPGIPPADILILDDAHMAENPLRDLFTLRIRATDAPEVFQSTLERLAALSPRLYAPFEDLIRGRNELGDPFLVPFPDWLQVIEQFTHDMDHFVSQLNEGSQSASVGYVWRSLRDKLPLLACYVTSTHIELRPVVFPSSEINHFAGPRQRIYLTATLGSVDDFQRRLGCARPRVVRPTGAERGQRGRRMIVMFTCDDDEESDQTRRDGLRHLWPVARKRVWLCGSWEEVEKCRSWVPNVSGRSEPPVYILRGSDEGPLQEFKAARLGHLFTAGRYDGLDFPGDDARIAFLPSLPVAVDAQERFFSAYLRDASFMKSRLSQRVAQALGRCNRSSADFAVYVLLDPRFERLFGGGDPAYLDLLPYDVKAEMEAALEKTQDGFVVCCEAAARFLSGEFAEWDSQVEACSTTDAVQPDSPPDSRTDHEVQAWHALWRGDPQLAAREFASAADSPTQAREQLGPIAFAAYCHAWSRYLALLWQHDPDAATECLDSLDKAASLGPSSWFTNILRSTAFGLRSQLSQPSRGESVEAVSAYCGSVLGSWESLLYECGTTGSAISNRIRRLSDCLASAHHDEVAEGLASLGRLVGFEAMRPRGDAMPDVIWRYGGMGRFVATIEAKVETENNRRVSVGDVNQAHSQGRWARQEYGPAGFTCVPILAVANSALEQGVQERLDNVAVVSLSAIQSLTNEVIRRFDTFRNTWNVSDSEARRIARARAADGIPDADWLLQACERSGGVVDVDRLVAAWHD